MYGRACGDRSNVAVESRETPRAVTAIRVSVEYQRNDASTPEIRPRDNLLAGVGHSGGWREGGPWSGQTRISGRTHFGVVKITKNFKF